MSRNYLARFNLFAVSANLKETAINTEQTLDTSMLIAEGNIIQLQHRREDNRDEANGLEEPNAVYDLGHLAGGAIEFSKAQSQHFGFVFGFGLGVAAPSAWGTGYKHAITPISGPDHPSFTGLKRLGSTILKRRFASLFIGKAVATFTKDSWAKLSADIMGTGKHTDNITKETVTAAYNATSLTLAANAVEGADAPGRLDSIHLVRVQVPATGEWKDVVCTAVSGATPAVLTITAPGGVATSTSYEIIYVPDEPAWCTFPARVEEPPLRVEQLVVKIGGKWGGAAFNGGHTIAAEVNSIEYNLDNQLAVEFRVGGTGTYASYALRKGRIQTIKLDRQSRDFIMQQHIEDNDTFGIYMKATGAEFETGKNYYAEFVFPKCGLLKADFKVDDKVVAEAGEFIVLQDDTYGSVICNVANKVAAYAG